VYQIQTSGGVYATFAEKSSLCSYQLSQLELKTGSTYYAQSAHNVWLLAALKNQRLLEASHQRLSFRNFPRQQDAKVTSGALALVSVLIVDNGGSQL